MPTIDDSLLDTELVMGRFRFAVILFACLAQPARAVDGNRLTYLDGSDPYYVGRAFPRLTTPQWVGEEGVEAVVVLAIDDMRGHEKWERYLRPILERRKKIAGRAPVSIMTNQIDPAEPAPGSRLQPGKGLSASSAESMSRSDAEREASLWIAHGEPGFTQPSRSATAPAGSAGASIHSQLRLHAQEAVAKAAPEVTVALPAVFGMPGEISFGGESER